MRYPVASIRLDCGINRISVSHDQHVLAVPLDNRHIRLYDLGGNRIANLPHRNRKVSCNIKPTCLLIDISLVLLMRLLQLLILLMHETAIGNVYTIDC